MTKQLSRNEQKFVDVVYGILCVGAMVAFFAFVIDVIIEVIQL